jgi:hypothetical protein
MNNVDNSKFIITPEFATSHRPIKLARLDDYPSRGETAYIRYRTSLMRTVMDEAKAESNTDKIEKMANLIVESAVNEDGSPMFTFESIQDVPSDTVMLIYRAIITNSSEEMEEEKKS